MSGPDPAQGSGFVHVEDELIYDGFVIRVVNGIFETPDGESFEPRSPFAPPSRRW